MKIFFLALLLSAVSLLSLSPASADIGWMEKIRVNQEMSIDYMYALMENPDAPRPDFYPARGWQSERALEEIYKAISRAERLAATGKGHLIKIPVYRFGPDDSGWERSKASRD